MRLHYENYNIDFHLLSEGSVKCRIPQNLLWTFVAIINGIKSRTRTIASRSVAVFCCSSTRVMVSSAGAEDFIILRSKGSNLSFIS